MPWQRLQIFRPSEVIGLGSTEGLDRFDQMAKRWHIYPLLLINIFDLHKIHFHPISGPQLVDYLGKEILAPQRSHHVTEVHGPKTTSIDLAKQAFRQHGAIPIPIFMFLLVWTSSIGKKLGLNLFPEDQIQRLLGKRRQRPEGNLDVDVAILKP